MPTKNSALSIIIITLVLAVHVRAYANTDDVIIGKVVKVADGDTITVLEDRAQHRNPVVWDRRPGTAPGFQRQGQSNSYLTWCSESRSGSSSKTSIAMAASWELCMWVLCA
jgi:endonuclease YncB( thermonuclease family)